MGQRGGFGVTPLRSVLVTLLALATAAGLAFTAAGLGARWWWVADLTTHFRVQLALGLGVCALLLLVLRARRWAATALAVALVNGLAVAPLVLPRPVADDATGTTVRLLLANVHRANRDHAAVLDLVWREDPVVAVLIETDPVWLDALAPLADTLPHWATHPREDDFGLAILSRHPLTEVITHPLGAWSLPALEASVHLPSHEVRLVATHPPPPMSAAGSAERDRELAELGALMGERAGHLVVCGDLNTANWSPSFRDLLSATGLSDSRRSHGIAATWNATMHPWLRIPIDHCLVSDGIEVTGLRAGAPIGSDHLPIMVDLSLAAADPDY